MTTNEESSSEGTPNFAGNIYQSYYQVAFEVERFFGKILLGLLAGATGGGLISPLLIDDARIIESGYFRSSIFCLSTALFVYLLSLQISKYHHLKAVEDLQQKGGYHSSRDRFTATIKILDVLAMLSLGLGLAMYALALTA